MNVISACMDEKLRRQIKYASLIKNFSSSSHFPVFHHQAVKSNSISEFRYCEERKSIPNLVARSTSIVK